MKQVIFRFLILLVPLFVFHLSVTGVARAGASNEDVWPSIYDRPSVEVGGHIADDGGSGEVSLLAPLIFSEGKDLFFLGVDARAFAFDPNDVGDVVFNIGGYIGYRTAIESHGVFGIWAGLDHLRTEESNAFTRAIAGVEYFGAHIITRANAFIPLDSTSDEWDVISGGFINTYDEKIPSGFDAEIGLRMAFPMDALVRPGEFRVFAGAYDFIGLDDDGGDVFGARARAELDLYLFDEAPDTRLSFEAGYAYDKHEGDQFSAGVKLSIPLGIANKITSHSAKDPVVAEIDSFGQDLFQPVRRNREIVSRVRLKDRRALGAGATGGVTLSNICGGTSGSLALNGGLASSSIKQGALVGIIDPTGLAKRLALNLATMITPDGRTLREILRTGPDTVRTTLKFAPGIVDFGGQKVEPAPAVALSSSLPAGQSITDATVSVDGNTCSLNLAVQPAVQQGLTLARICGGSSANISLNSGLVSSSVKQGAVLGTIDPSGAASALQLDIGSMIAPNGKTLQQLLVSKPATLASTFKFAPGTVDFASQTVRPAAAFALSSGNVALQAITDATLTVNSLSCSIDLQIKQSNPPPPPPPKGLTLATICGGVGKSLPVSNIHNVATGSATIKQGDQVGTIEPDGAATPLVLDVAKMVDVNGTTLSQLLASGPATLVTTLYFPPSTVDLAISVVEPSLAVSNASVQVVKQRLLRFSVNVDSASCSVVVKNGIKPQFM